MSGIAVLLSAKTSSQTNLAYVVGHHTGSRAPIVPDRPLDCTYYLRPVGEASAVNRPEKSCSSRLTCEVHSCWPSWPVKEHRHRPPARAARTPAGSASSSTTGPG